jgi:hypothetical protein
LVIALVSLVVVKYGRNAWNGHARRSSHFKCELSSRGVYNVVAANANVAIASALTVLIAKPIATPAVLVKPNVARYVGIIYGLKFGSGLLGRNELRSRSRVQFERHELKLI